MTNEVASMSRLSISMMNLELETRNILCSDGIPVSIKSAVHLKIEHKDKKSLKSFCDLFVGMSEKDVNHVFKSLLEGHQSSVIGVMSLEDINRKQEAFKREMMYYSKRDLSQMGIQMVSFTITEVIDVHGLIEIKRQALAAINESESRVTEAELMKDQLINQIISSEELIIQQNLIERESLKQEKELELTKLNNQIEYLSHKSTADKMAELQSVLTCNEIKTIELDNQLLETDRRVEESLIQLAKAESRTEQDKMTVDSVREAVQQSAHASYVKTTTDAFSDAIIMMSSAINHYLSYSNIQGLQSIPETNDEIFSDEDDDHQQLLTTGNNNGSDEESQPHHHYDDDDIKVS